MNLLTWGFYDLFFGGIVASLAEASAHAYDHVLIGVGLLLTALVGYLLGSVNTAVVISRVFFHDDVRKYGSGNAGTTNILRTYGKKAAIFTFVGDGLKGVLAILFSCAIFGGVGFFNVLAAYLAAFFAVFGHVFPCFAHFKGGKGFATTATCILFLNPVIFLILLFVFFPLVLGTHFVSLGSVVTVLLYPMILGSFDIATTHYGVNTMLALAMGILVTACHHKNLSRLFKGTERKTYFFGQKAKEAKQNGEKK